MTDPATESAAVVTISLEDAMRVRDEIRGLNHALNHMVGSLLRFKVPDTEACIKDLDGLVDRLTVAIHGAKRP